ncbi:MAG: pyruvate kinase [Pseudomonadota bacterium]
MHRNRNAKIVATLGPASSSVETIETLFREGVDVFRLNFSHGTHDDHRERYSQIRAIEKKHGRAIGILADLQGPKIRIAQMQGGKAELVAGARFRLDMDAAHGDATRAPLPHEEVFRALEPGHDLLLDDGKLRLRVDNCGPDFAETTVIAGGVLSDRKGVNLPGAILPISALTEKDRKDLEFALELGVDWIALSFVQRPDDVAEARKLIQGRAGILIKLEKPAAIDCLDELVELADAVMVARGDLGVEMPPEKVPGLQKKIVRQCRAVGRPVVVATQMLESMISAPTPTRAEASDVAAAVYDGADAVMLSAETAAGSYAHESVHIMNRILEEVEVDPLYRSILSSVTFDPEPTAADAITRAAAQVARTVNAAAICTYTTSGSTAYRAARERPTAPLLVLTPRETTSRRLALLWGAHCVKTGDATSFGDMVRKACDVVLDEGFADIGQRIVITAGVPFGTPGATNILRIASVGREPPRRTSAI